MKPLGLIILLVLIFLGVFAMANWGVLTAPTALSFLVFTLEGPLGIILLAMMLALALLFTFYIMALRTSMFVADRKHAQAWRSQYELAEQEEASRLADLRAHLEREFERLHAKIQDMDNRMTARSDGIEQSLLKSLGDTTNTLSAYVAEVDDKLDRALPRLTS